MAKHYPPKFDESKFNCISCGVFSAQYWYQLYSQSRGGFSPTKVSMCICSHCSENTFWDRDSGAMVIPDSSSAPPCHVDMPKECQGEYGEARSVVNKSPRAAAALLRLAIQKLMIALGQSGKNINDDIATLVAKGLPVEVQQALDICRVVGNHAVHPGEIDLNDTPDIAANLFEMINFIAEDRISRPKRVSELYARLPEKDRDKIVKRDQKVSNGRADAKPESEK